MPPKCHFEKMPSGTIFRPHMHKAFLLLLLLAVGGGASQAAPLVTNSVAGGRVLIMENSTMPLPAAKATLIIGPLTRANGVYIGDFKVKVFPYFFKSDRGRLLINVTDKVLAAVSEGKTVAVTGTATSTKNGIVRHVEITAIPKDGNHGTVSLWFMVGDQKMIFAPDYHFADQVKAIALAPAHPQTISFR